MINMKTINLKIIFNVLLKVTFVILLTFGCSPVENSLGLFEKNQDVGRVGLAGSVDYDQSNDSYLITGGGENMWFTLDGLHFVYREMRGSFISG